MTRVKSTLKRLAKNAGLLFFILLTYNTGLQAQTAKQDTGTYSLSLKQAVDYAIQHTSKSQNAQLDVKIAQKKVEEIRGIGLPQINGSSELDYNYKPATILFPSTFGIGTYQTLYQENLISKEEYENKAAYLSSLPPQEIHFSTKYNMTAGVTASQLIFDGTYLVGLKAASTYVELASKSAQVAKIDVAATVTKAYYSVLVARKRLGLLDANMERLQKAYNDTKAMYNSGFVEKLDVDRLEVALNNLSIEKQKVENLINLSMNLLKFQMGMQQTGNLVLSDSLVEGNLPEPAQVQPNYNKRVEYALLEANRALNQLDLKRNKAGYLPSLAAFVSYNYQAQRDEFNFFNTNYKWYPVGIAGAKLTVPIFDGLQKSARIQQSRLNIQKIDNDISNLGRAIDMEVSNAVIQYENNYKTLQNQRRNLDLAQEVVRVTQIKYEQGVGSNIEVVNAEAGLKEAQTNYFGALYDLLISEVDLQKANGTLY